jgi:hypothetical protein
LSLGAAGPFPPSIGYRSQPLGFLHWGVRGCDVEFVFGKPLLIAEKQVFGTNNVLVVDARVELLEFTSFGRMDGVVLYTVPVFPHIPGNVEEL